MVQIRFATGLVEDQEYMWRSMRLFFSLSEAPVNPTSWQLVVAVSFRTRKACGAL